MAGNRYTATIPTPGVTANWGTTLNDIIGDLDEAFDATDTGDGGVGHSHNGTDGEGPKLRPAALDNVSAAGVVVADWSGTQFYTRTITGSSGITVTNGTGVSGNIDIAGGVFDFLGSAGVTAATISSSTYTLPDDKGFYSLGINGNTTISMPTKSGAQFFLVEVNNSSGYTVNFESAVYWAGGTQPTISTGRDLFIFATGSTGGPWIGARLAANVS